nr:ADP-ribosylglycohydrolase family protein [Gluconobacter wancherniae]
MRIAITHSGDSDSKAAIAGNLLGLMFPDEVLAHLWRASALPCSWRSSTPECEAESPQSAHNDNNSSHCLRLTPKDRATIVSEVVARSCHHRVRIVSVFRVARIYKCTLSGVRLIKH